MLVLESDGLCLAFIHIPKTAGTTLRQMLENAIKQRFLGTEVNSVIHCPSPKLYSSKIHTSTVIPENQPVETDAPRILNLSGDSHSLPNGNDRNIRLPQQTKQELPTSTEGPRVVCYGYWQISDGVDLAHVPRRHFQDYYPPPDAAGQNGKLPDYWSAAGSDQENYKPQSGYPLQKPDKSRFIWITCVRNPYTRIFSAYCWYNKKRGLPASPQGFRFFLRYRLRRIVNDYRQMFATQQPPAAEFIHFIPMWMMVSEQNGVPNVDYIVRQENFESDMARLMTRLKLPWSNEHRNAHCREESPPLPYSYLDCYDDDTRAIVEDLYQEDFNYFGYRRILSNHVGAERWGTC